MGAGDVTQFHQGVGDRGGVAVSDQQVAFLRLDGRAGHETIGLDAVGQHHGLGTQPLTVIKPHPIAIDLDDPRPALVDVRRVEHPVGRRGRVQNAVAVDQQAPFEALVQLHVTLAQGLGADQLAGHAMGLQVQVFTVGHRHLFGVGRQPQGAVATVRTALGQVCCLLAPALRE